MTRPSGDALARLRAKRIETLRSEGFTEPEIAVLKDRRISTRGLLKIRRERAAELRGLTKEEKREWAEQNVEGLTEQDAADDIRRVSPPQEEREGVK